MFRMNWVTLEWFVPKICSPHCKYSGGFFKDIEIRLPHWIGNSKIHIENVMSKTDYPYGYSHILSSDDETEIDFSDEITQTPKKRN